MKRTLRKLSFVAVALAAVSALAGCTKKNNDETKLNVIVLNRGYGEDWIKSAKSIWEAANPGYSINLTLDAKAGALIQKHIYSKNNMDDLYICTDAAWKSYADDGKLLELDTFVDEEVNGVAIKDKLTKEYRGHINYTLSGGRGSHVYRLPFISGTGGIYYNEKLFTKYKWKIPTTYEELIETVDKIRTDHKKYDDEDDAVIKPFVITSQNPDYFDYLVFSWWGQISGQEAITDFFNYQDSDVFNTASTTHPAYAGLKQATQLWANIFNNPANYHKQTAAKYAQSDFLEGHAAMIINCDWIYKEIGDFLASAGKSYADYADTFEMKLMGAPTVTGATNPHAGYIVGEDQFIVVPKSTIKADLAKSFIKTLVSDQVLKIFNQKAQGFMAYDLSEGTYEAENTCMESIISYRNSLTYAFTNNSSARCYLNGNVDVWCQSGLRPYEDIADGAGVDGLFSAIYNTARTGWNDWQY